MNVFNEQQLKSIYDYIINYQRTNGKAPSYRLIMKNCNLGSLATVYRNVNELHNRGLIEKSSSEWRSIGVKDTFECGISKPVYLVGECPCGKPIEAVENIEGSYMLPADLFGSEEHMMLRAKGNSMVDTGIFNGDIMVVRKQDYANSGEIVIAMMDGEATAKIFKPRKNCVVLRAANDETYEDGGRVYPDIVTKNCVILGVVDNVIHKPKLRK